MLHAVERGLMQRVFDLRRTLEMTGCYRQRQLRKVLAQFAEGARNHCILGFSCRSSDKNFPPSAKASSSGRIGSFIRCIRLRLFDFGIANDITLAPKSNFA